MTEGGREGVLSENIRKGGGAVVFVRQAWMKRDGVKTKQDACAQWPGACCVCADCAPAPSHLVSCRCWLPPACAVPPSLSLALDSQVRAGLAQLGLRSLDELVGRADYLKQRDTALAKTSECVCWVLMCVT